MNEIARRIPHVMLVAGEPSGDALGGELMDALLSETDGQIRVRSSATLKESN